MNIHIFLNKGSEVLVILYLKNKHWLWNSNLANKCQIKKCAITGTLCLTRHGATRVDAMGGIMNRDGYLGWLDKKKLHETLSESFFVFFV